MFSRKVARKCCMSLRLYHSNPIEHVKPLHIKPLNYGKQSPQYKILSLALQEYVPKHGFSERSIVESLNKLGYPSSMISSIGASNSPSFFHSSTAVMELMKFQLVDKRCRLTEEINPDVTPPYKLPSLEHLLLKRLEMDKPIGGQLSDLMSQLAIPSEFLFETAIPELHRLSDDMVYFSNEKDHHDSAWYAKRMAVSSTYIGSQLFMAQDKSHNFQETFAFAKDKLNRVMRLGEYYNNTEEFAWYTLMSAVNLVKSQLVRG
ncbi:fmp53p [Saccharomyces arboricola H-6]|uniref:Ubiquinone biosynthesis protein n=1 Tax=Saccharomyces arboricola (strain H-6 / AS 2.3317 / CBS 10644) TaxID=1160507 RepID=J8Q1Z8_SACAR|nr:fmp53p [Saccharomyces arboricola H-6]